MERTVAIDAALERRRRLLFDSQSRERITKLGAGCVRADRKSIEKSNKILDYLNKNFNPVHKKIEGEKNLKIPRIYVEREGKSRTTKPDASSKVTFGWRVIQANELAAQVGRPANAILRLVCITSFHAS